MQSILVVVVFIGLGIGLFVLLLFLFRSWLFGRFVVSEFKRCNVVVDGKKGTGKDLLFQYVIWKRDEHYYANISYGDAKYTHLLILKNNYNQGDYEQERNDADSKP